jgi:hypothetical protein
VMIRGIERRDIFDDNKDPKAVVQKNGDDPAQDKICGSRGETISKLNHYQLEI